MGLCLAKRTKLLQRQHIATLSASSCSASDRTCSYSLQSNCSTRIRTGKETKSTSRRTISIFTSLHLHMTENPTKVHSYTLEIPRSKHAAPYQKLVKKAYVRTPFSPNPAKGIYTTQTSSNTHNKPSRYLPGCWGETQMLGKEKRSCCTLSKITQISRSPSNPPRTMISLGRSLVSTW
jgi:hypothetical protein